MKPPEKPLKKEQVDAIIVMLAAVIVVIRQLENTDYTMS